ncbi:MAG: hypothetical protein H6898_12595 [Rhodobacter sp.]|nr:hypothetical protein [Paracoccaceae bacterium]MCC0077394.1 hypothetical protein [Rhodobacter sp.]
MQTPVFIDDLPDSSAVGSRKSERYRQVRNRALAEMLLDEAVTWHERPCPACGQDRASSRNFSQALMPFQRCSACNTIYAARVPDQRHLDQERLQMLSDLPPEPADSAKSTREFEFVSILNWLRLTEARHGKPLNTVAEYRFSSQAPSLPQTVERIGSTRDWTFLPLSDSGSANFGDLRDHLQASSPDAVLLYGEMDRIAEPAQLLRVVRANLPRGSLVFIATSCADGLEYEILGADSPSFVPLDRLNIFSVGGFSALVEELGYKAIEISTPGRLDAVILQKYFTEIEGSDVPFWSGFFRSANKDRLHDLQILLQRSLRSGVMRFVLET